MKVALIGATGNAGSRILAELTLRGHTVTAIVRNPERVAAQVGVTAKKGDVNAPDGLAALLRGHDVVISSLMFIDIDPQKLITAVRASAVKRYLVVGGAGSVEIAPGLKLIDSPNLPPEYKPEAVAGTAFLDQLRNEHELNWTVLSPSAMFVPGERTGKVQVGKDQFLTEGKGSSISFEDYAVALVDELENPAHSHQQFTVRYLPCHAKGKPYSISEFGGRHFGLARTGTGKPH